MTPAVLQRKITLKRQAVKLIRAEEQDLIFQKGLLGYRDQLAGRIGKKFDPALSGRFDRDLSAKLDHVQILIDFLNGGKVARVLMKGFSPDHPFAFPLRSGAGNGESTA